MLDYYNREKLGSQHLKAAVKASAQNRHSGTGSSLAVEYVLLSMGIVFFFLLVATIALQSLLHAAIAHLNNWVALLGPPVNPHTLGN